MDILIRGLNPIHISEIDRKAVALAEKLGRKFSRNDYLKMLVEQDYELQLAKLKDDKFDHALAAVVAALDCQASELKDYAKSNAELLSFLMEE